VSCCSGVFPQKTPGQILPVTVAAHSSPVANCRFYWGRRRAPPLGIDFFAAKSHSPCRGVVRDKAKREKLRAGAATSPVASRRAIPAMVLTTNRRRCKGKTEAGGRPRACPTERAKHVPQPDLPPGRGPAMRSPRRQPGGGSRPRSSPDCSSNSPPFDRFSFCGLCLAFGGGRPALPDRTPAAPIVPLPNLERAQRDHREQHAQNVKPCHHLRLVPALLLEVVVKG
jgi:hypothetical protein